MPWCTTCDRYLSPSTVSPDGRCPTCGEPVDAGEGPAKKAWIMPWHYKALLGVFAVYLGYRAFQGIDWLIRQL